MSYKSSISPADAAEAQRANAVGVAAMQVGDTSAAISAFQAATIADALAIELWLNLAHACRVGQDAAAEHAALDQALKLDRTNFLAQLRMAQLLQTLGDEAEAIKAWSGVQQLAAQLPSIPTSLQLELTAGEEYCAKLHERISCAATTALAQIPFKDTNEEHRIRTFVDIALGRRQVFKNECAGLEYPFLPADEFFDSRLFPWFSDLEAGTEIIAEELSGLLDTQEEVLRPYVKLEQGVPANHWSALDSSLDWSACFLWEYGVPNPAILARCPCTANLIANLPIAHMPDRAPNVFFSLLKPHSRIPPHTGVTNTRAIVHLALDIPPSCGFRVGGETREWIVGKAFAFDDTIEHEAWNESDSCRAILILDTWNPHLSSNERDAINAYFSSTDVALKLRKKVER